ncbi:MAG: hypothetical protein JWN25_1449 [Verrucomicrobiales bacterium]|nr:hypothetical protein [Verrucomicrobiales bacterium]MDB6129414.1 hypothetical protein [Verrucomicrobiales bacterium]
MVVFAFSRIPGLFPPNFSAVYALIFCAGVYFPGKSGFVLPFVTMLVSDLCLNFFYYSATAADPRLWVYLGINYICYVLVFLLGRRMGRKVTLLKMVGGSLLAAIGFYILTNTLSWLINPYNNPEYLKTVQGWLMALTIGTGKWPQTWEFFRNTLLSSGLFTGLFAAVMKFQESAAESKVEKEAGESAENEPETGEAEEAT